MIQELFGGDTSTLIAGERNSNYCSSVNTGGGVGGGGGGGALLQTTQSPSSSTATITTTTTTTSTPSAATSSENQNLRCPRCDSSNTKFCYYNNYNLTQPRYFCKTCRRYWTKGGALRNVPIGGGCRRNRNIGVSSSSATKTTTTKLKAVEHVEHVIPLPLPNQILWGSPQNSHILSLLRSTQNQNQSPNPNFLGGCTMKEEGNLMESHSQSHMMTKTLVSNGFVNHQTSSSYDGVGHVLGNPFWKNNQGQTQQQNGGFLFGEQHQQQHQNSSGIHELYQKLKSGNNYCSERSQVFMGNVVSSSSSMSNILEPTSVSVAGGGGELGYWNLPTSPLSWSDLPTTNGAYP